MINVNIIFFYFRNIIPLYDAYLLLLSKIQTARDHQLMDFIQVATNICMIQDLFPTLNPDLCSVPCLMDIVRALLAIKYRVRWEYSEYTRNKLEVSLGRICQVRKVK